MRQFPLIAREGWPFILTALLLLISSFRLGGLILVLPSLLLLLSLMMLFRDPHRNMPSRPLALVSPVDGRIRSVEPTDKGALQRESIRIVIKVNHFGAYSARSPIEGKVLNLMDNLADGSRLLGIGGLWLRTDEHDDVVVLIKGKNRWARPKSFVGYGERLGQGQRFAFTRLASHLEVYVPVNCKVLVTAGMRIRAGSDIIAMLVHK